MPGNSVLAGPFQGGLSTYSDSSSIQDNELVVCDNFEVDMDGSLKSRPPFVDRSIRLSLSTSGGDMRVLGYYYQSSAPGVSYVVASDGNSSTYYFDGSVWHLITNTLSAVSMVQFDGKLWLVAPTGVCGYWTLAGGWVADTWCPNGESITVYKGRMFVAAGASATSRTKISSANTAPADITDIYYSAILGQSPWLAVTTGANQSPGIQTFKVNAGDGQATVALQNFQGTIYIFRTASIWTFSYASTPTAGQVSLLVPNIGLADAQAYVAFENYFYFMFDGKAYTLFSGIATLFNPKVPFVAVNRTNIYTPFAVSVLNRRIIFTYYDTLYVYNLRSQTWTTWHVPAYGSIGKIFQLTGALNADIPVAVAHPNVQVAAGSGRTAKLLYITDAFTNEVEAGGYVCSMTTKTYDYGAPANYKRLFWWAVDASYRTGMVAKQVPEIYSYQIGWGALSSLGRTWSGMRSYTWSTPSAGDFAAAVPITSVPSGPSPLRKTTRLLKSSRFKQTHYTVSLSVDGSRNTCPARIFLLETFVLVKDHVSKSVN